MIRKMICTLSITFLLNFCYLPIITFATISPSFSQFLRKNFGNEAEQLIARRDLGSDGSFGGGKSREKTKKRPVVFVHGLANQAGNLDATLDQFRKIGGYRNSELFGTTYSCGSKKWLQDRMECRHVKQIRLLIRAVAGYTLSQQIDVIGYSMGSPIARKAILGGICVDTGENLGPPLTHLVNTFIGVGGANRDAVHLCRLFPGSAGPCNGLNGIRCHSRFLDDINYSRGYESTARVFTIRSIDDGIVGALDCDGNLASSINGQNAEIVLHGFSHQLLVLGTGEQQLRLLSNGN